MRSDGKDWSHCQPRGHICASVYSIVSSVVVAEFCSFFLQIINHLGIEMFSQCLELMSFDFTCLLSLLPIHTFLVM